MSRRHRWVRGDWQVAAWILPRHPTKSLPNAGSLSWLSRWKLFDNLRRSMVAPTLTLAVGAGLALRRQGRLVLYPRSARAVFRPARCWSGSCRFRGLRPGDAPWLWLVAHPALAGLANRLETSGFAFAVAPYEAYCNVHATVVTLYRLLVSRRKLLQWTTSHDADQRSAKRA